MNQGGSCYYAPRKIQHRAIRRLSPKLQSADQSRIPNWLPTRQVHLWYAAGVGAQGISPKIHLSLTSRYWVRDFRVISRNDKNRHLCIFPMSQLNQPINQKLLRFFKYRIWPTPKIPRRNLMRRKIQAISATSRKVASYTNYRPSTTKRKMNTRFKW